MRYRLTAWMLALSALTVGITGCTNAPAPEPASPSAALWETPPMGWNSWNNFGCSVTEADVKAAADAIVADGLLQIGYRYVNVDDCWQAPARDRKGRLSADPARFPSGIRALAQDVHARGLLFGIYATPGRFTCGELYNHYPGQLGSLGHEAADAQTFADWGVDYLKYDWCKADQDGVDRRTAFTNMRQALNQTGHPIALSIHDVPERPVPDWRPSVANLWRTTRASRTPGPR